MFRIDLLILSAALLLNAVLALLVISRDNRSVTNRLFFSLVVIMSVWSVANYLSYRNTDALFYARLVLCFATAFATIFFFFTATYPRKEATLTKSHLLFVAWSLMVMGLTLSPLVFKAIIKKSNTTVGLPVVGPGIILFGLTVVFYDFGGLVVFARKALKANGEERYRRIFLLIGLFLMLLTIIILNFVLPSAFANTSFIPYAPLFILPFLSFTAYAIIKHRLLDIRAATARLTAYTLSLGLIGVIYGTFILGVTSVLPFVNPMAMQLIYIGFAMLTAVLYPTVRRFFAKLTNRLFFQDAYDSQQFFNHLNRVLVKNMELEKLLTESMSVLSSTFKPESCAISLSDPSMAKDRMFGTLTHPISNSDRLTFARLSTNFNGVVVTDLLQEHNNKDLIGLLRRNDIALFALLKSNAEEEKQIGYILLGPKKSGRLYDKQDIQVLEAVANEMVIAIQNALRFEEIENFNVTLQNEVDSATSKLRRTNLKLQELDATKDDFISMASHQLRTPLTSVKGYLSMVLEGDAGKLNPTQAEMLRQAFSSSQRMVSLITDLLNISRLKTGKFVIETAPVNLAELVQGEVSQLIETAKAKNISLIYKKPASFSTLAFDEVKTRQVVMNFIDNAIYYTPQGGHIRVELTEKPATVELRVIDDGIGVPRSEQHHLFSKFYRATNARKARPDGTGLGLFMAKKVIVSQGGSIIFSSEEGHGSTFGFTFIKDRLKISDAATVPASGQKQGNAALSGKGLAAAKRSAAHDSR